MASLGAIDGLLVLTVLVPCVVRIRTATRADRFAAVDGGVLLLERGEVSEHAGVDPLGA